MAVERTAELLIDVTGPGSASGPGADKEVTFTAAPGSSGDIYRMKLSDLKQLVKEIENG